MVSLINNRREGKTREEDGKEGDGEGERARNQRGGNKKKKKTHWISGKKRNLEIIIIM